MKGSSAADAQDLTPPPHLHGTQSNRRYEISRVGGGEYPVDSEHHSTPGWKCRGSWRDKRGTCLTKGFVMLILLCGGKNSCRVFFRSSVFIEGYGGGKGEIITKSWLLSAVFTQDRPHKCLNSGGTSVLIYCYWFVRSDLGTLQSGRCYRTER